MAGERSLRDALLDAAVFVPVGVAISIAEDLPELAERGRARVDQQVEVARVVGRLALAQMGRMRAHGAPPPVPGEDEARERNGAPMRSTKAGAGAGKGPRTNEAVPDASSLPIPGYDTLAASQVVQRLSSLRPDELDAVRRYEVATRGRRTVLNRIAQLGAAGSSSS